MDKKLRKAGLLFFASGALLLVSLIFADIEATEYEYFTNPFFLIGLMPGIVIRCFCGVIFFL
ncbi:MAG: hypothetical protein K6E51_07125 [Treponema sp.]|nr:hypothetical protein [Treponema sp.]